MPSPRPTHWLPIAGLLLLVAIGLSWLLLVFAGERSGVGAAVVEKFDGPNPPATFAEAAALPDSAWRPVPAGLMVRGADSGPSLLRVTLRNPTRQPQHGILADSYWFADEIELGWRDGQQWETSRSGERVPSREKSIVGREPAFPLLLPAEESKVVYLRVSDHYRPFSQLEWWPDQRAYFIAATRALLAEGLYLGGLFSLLGYNALLWLRLRMTDIGYYVLYLGTVAIFLFLARAFPGWLGWPLPSPILETVLVCAVAASGYFLVQFARAFLVLDTLSPRVAGIAQILRFLMLFLAAGAVTVPLLTKNQWLNATAAGIALTHLTLLSLGILAWRRGSRQARYFILAFGCLFLVSAVVVTAHIWNLPIKDASLRCFMVGSGLEMLLLSLAVADRFAQAQQEKAEAQAQLLEEAEQRRAVEEAYADELEVEVRERTRDLQAADADKDRMLAVIGHDLRSPLVALTQRAEQTRTGKHAATAAAASGQMRDFAAQVSAAGRQMLLLIEDIVVWARMRTGTQPGASIHAVSLLVGPVVQLHRPMAERRALALEMDVPEGLTVRTDFVLAQTLARNLVGNAVKFARSRVDLVARAVGNEVEIAVCDDGPGLPPEVAARLRGEGVSDGEQVGLGLRLSQEIAAQLGVRLTATALADGGTEMSVVLPAGIQKGASA